MRLVLGSTAYNSIPRIALGPTARCGASPVGKLRSQPISILGKSLLHPKERMEMLEELIQNRKQLRASAGLEGKKRKDRGLACIRRALG